MSSKKYALEGAILFLLISKHTDAQSALLTQINQSLNKEFKEHALSDAFKHVLQLFITTEIIITPFNGQSELESHNCLSRFANVDIDCAAEFLKLFRVRIIEHNLFVVSKYYQRISLRRLQELTKLPADELEYHLSDMSFSGDLKLKIDRPAGIISFQVKRTPEQILTEWSGDIGKMLSLMESTCHLINRENMVHKA